MTKFNRPTINKFAHNTEKYETVAVAKQQVKWKQIQERILCHTEPTIHEEYAHDIGTEYGCCDNLSLSNPMHEPLPSPTCPLEIDTAELETEDPACPPPTPIAKCRSIYDVLRLARKKSFMDLVVKQDAESEHTI